MKRILALILALLMLTAVLVGCGDTPNDSSKDDTNNENPNAMTFEAGFGRTKIDFDLPFKLAGDANDRPAKSFYDDLYVSSAAVRSSDGTTVLILSVDAAEITSAALDPIREAISEATKIPVDNIIVNYSHSHFTPHYEPKTSEGKTYNALLKAAVDASKKSVIDLAPATIYTGVIETEGMTSTRRFIDKNKNGKIEIQANNEIENPVDENVYVINFDREGKKDVVLANFAAHSTESSGTNNQASSSYYGPCRETFERKLNKDAYLTLLQGAAGNSIPKAWVESKGPGPNNNYLQFDPKFIGADAYGAKLAEYINECLENNMTKQVSERGVRVLSKDFSIVVDNTRKSDVARAQEICNEYSANGDSKKYQDLCKKYNIVSTYEAYKIVVCNSMGGYTKLEINTIAIGNIGIAATGYEMLSETGKEIFEGSPFEFNFVLGYTNDARGYIPQEEAFAVGGYEVYSCRFVKGTAEKISAQAIKQLNKLYEAE